MTPEAQRIAIAEACGYSRHPEGKKWKSHYARAWYTWVKAFPDGSCHYFNEIPDYLNDLNAMHKAEKHLGDVDAWLRYEGLLAEAGTKFLFHATAAQRAEAFLRTLNLWEES